MIKVLTPLTRKYLIQFHVESDIEILKDGVQKPIVDKLYEYIFATTYNGEQVFPKAAISIKLLPEKPSDEQLRYRYPCHTS